MDGIASRRHPCPNQPATGLSRINRDFKECPSPWICEKLGCQFVPRDGFNAPNKPGFKKRSLRERVERVNRLLKDTE